MGKINNEIIYVQDIDISDLDYVIGTNGNTNAKITKNFLLGSLKNYLKAGLSPLTGGTLQLTEITYTGGLYSTFAQVINALDPTITIGQYHVVVVTLNGNKALFKLQNRVVGLGQTAVLVGDFIVLSTAQVNADWSSTTGVSQVLNKPTIPASQVNSDWNSTSGVSQVLNKPTIPASQVNSDWNSTSGVSQILNKPTVDGSETKVNSGTNVTVTGAGTVANPYVISSPVAAAWLPGDTKEVVCNSTYLANNFVSSGTTAGLGTNERLGWAIMNGNNGTPNDNGKVVIAYGSSYATLGATGGSENAVLIGHNHVNASSGYNGLRAQGAINLSTATSGFYLPSEETNPNYGMDESGVRNDYQTGTGKNMQPYVVRLRIVKL